MTPELWEQIKDLYHKALKLEKTRQAAFLKKACAGDQELQGAIERLLKNDLQAGSFLKEPAYARATQELASDPQGSWIGRQIRTFEFVSLLGVGGMGEVYRARDTKLQRDVAIKVLPSSLAWEPERLKRFKNEARMLAALNHPHIGAIYGLEETEGRQALILDLVEGPTLADRLAKGPIPVREALAIAAQIAEALESAHERGIVHRDLKPANIKITAEGNVKVLDFGLAKAIEGDAASLDSSEMPSATTEGMILGTPAYMSPEQARGQKVDKRTDIWAFGCVIYEMLTRRRAFLGDTASDVIAALIGREADWTALPETTPANIHRLLRRCFEKDPKRRLRDIGEARIEIDCALEDSLATIEQDRVDFQGRPVARKRLPWRLARKTSSFALGLMVLILVGWMLRLRSQPSIEIRSLAVLPLESLSSDASQEYFADGMTDELITDLGQISALRVISRTSVMPYKRARKPLPQIARELSVDAVVEGTVLRSGDRVRITAQLIQASADKHIWSQSYEGDLRDTLAVQNKIARAIADQIRINLTPREQAALKKAKVVNPEAYESYLKGRYFWNKRTADGLKMAVAYFDRAIEKDANYAQAYAGLADSYALMGDWEYGVLAPKDALPRAKAAAINALELDNSLGEAHTSLAFTLDSFDWDWGSAESEFKRALELNPGYATAHQWYSWHLIEMGRNSEAIDQMRKAESLDPLSLIISADMSDTLLIARRYDEAIQQSRKAIGMDSNFAVAHYELGQALVQKQMYNEAIAELDKAIELSGGSTACTSNLAYAYGVLGRRNEAVKILNELKNQPEKNASEIALVYVGLAEKDEAMEWLEKAYEERFNSSILLRPAFDSLRSDRRFQDLLRRLGLNR